MIPAIKPRHLFLFLTALCTLIAPGFTVVTGVTGGSIGTRREIRSLAGDKDSWNIYLLALSSMQNASQSSDTSYYTIAAIHGLPQQEYDGVAGRSGTEYLGYCTHDSNYFPTWHRPYVALFEQTLQKHAVDQANLFNGSAKSRYLKAAQNLRSPYLDWTQNAPKGTAFPSYFDHATASVILPQGDGTVSSSIPNPLYSYRFDPVTDALFWQPYTQDKSTKRYPTTIGEPGSPSNQSSARAAIDALQPKLHDRLYKLLTNYTDYNMVSNDAWIPGNVDVDRQDSFESLHNEFHGQVGGPGGFMPILDISSYDPIFWLHHTMMDRVFALWQALHQDSWFEPQEQMNANYWIENGTTSSASTGLKPFKKNDAGDLWTSDDVRNWTVFGYTYPELQQGWSTDSVRSAVDHLYSQQEDPTITAQAPQTPQRRSRIDRRLLGGVAKSSVVQGYKYFLNVRASKNALRQPYTVYAFLGEPGPKSTLVTADNLAGTLGIASRLLTEEQAASMPTVLVTSTLPLNRPLKQRIKSGELVVKTADDINNYLKNHLTWKVLANNGTVLEANQVSDLVLSVGRTTMKGSSSRGFVGQVVNGALRSSSSVLSDVTAGKPGGLCGPDTKLYMNSTQ